MKAIASSSLLRLRALLVVVSIASAIVVAAGCKQNDIDSAVACNFAPAAGASFCPPNTHPSAIASSCDSLDASLPDSGQNQCVPTNLNGCFVNCTPARCGDGYTDPGEGCDLGAQNGTGKGCDTTCHLTEGASCGANGNLRCSPDSTNVQICEDNLWQSQTTCTSNQVCDSTMLRCVNAPAYCDTPGASRCVSDVQRQICGTDNRWTDNPCPIDMPSCLSLGGTVTCTTQTAVLSNSQYRANVSVGSIVGTAQNSKYSATFGEPPVY